MQPVYKKEVSSRDHPLLRSRSAPNLSEWPVMRKTVHRAPAAADEEEDEETVRRRFEKHRMKRRRALSQNKMRSLLRRTKATSEIDLAHIDKEATFGADIASYEILSRVVDALETAVPNQPPVAVHHHMQQPSSHLLQDVANSVSLPAGGRAVCSTFGFVSLIILARSGFSFLLLSPVLFTLCVLSGLNRKMSVVEKIMKTATTATFCEELYCIRFCVHCSELEDATLLRFRNNIKAFEVGNFSDTINKRQKQ